MNKTVSILSVWLAAGTLAAMTVNVESTDPDRTITAGEVSTLVSSGEDLVKTGGGRFIIDRSLKGYKGEIRVEGGYLQALHNEAFGDTDKGTVISSGATLEFKNDSEYIAFGKEQFTVSGVGVDGCGAFRHIGLVKSQWTAVFQKVKLAGDTRFGGVTNASGGYLRWDIRGSQGTFDMQGHDLEIVTQFGMAGATVVNPGNIVVTGTNSTFCLEGASARMGGSSANTLTMGPGTLFSSQQFGPPLEWSLVLDGCTCNEQKTTDNFTGDACLNGPVTVTSRGAKFTGYNNRHWSFGGDVTLDGAISSNNSGIRLVVIQTADDEPGARRGVYQTIRDHVQAGQLDSNVLVMLHTVGATEASPYASGGDFGMESLNLHLTDGSALAFAGSQDWTRYYQTDGYVKMSGADKTHNFTNVSVSGNATLDWTDMGRVDIQTNALIVGAAYPSIARLKIANTVFPTNWPNKVKNGFTPLTVGARPNTTANGMGVAAYSKSRGILEIGAGAFVTNMLWMGYSENVSEMYSTCHGSIFVRGGELTSIGADSRYNFVGRTGSGYLEVSSGSFVAKSWFYLGGGQRGRGLFYQTGGSVLFESSGLVTGQYSSRANPSAGVYYLKNGTTSSWGPIILGKTKWDTSNAGSRDQVTIANGTLSVDNGIDLAGEPYARTTLNLNGGLLYASFTQVLTNELQTQISTGDPRDLPDTFAWVNFNGGTYRRRKSTKSGVYSRPGYLAESFFFGDPAHLRITSYGKGAIFDTYNQTLKLDHSVTAPSGQGLLSLALPAGTSIADWTFAGAPYIEITGDGEGATAVAEYDSANGRVTGFTVTAPGHNYTTMTASLVRGGYTNAIPLVCTLGAPTPGGLVKKGAGTLNLMVANTYGGPTRVEQGVLRAHHADAIPAGSELEIAGGTLDAGGYEKAFGAISASSGTFVNVAGTCASFEKTGAGAFFFDAPLVVQDGVLDVKEGTLRLAQKQPGLFVGDQIYANNTVGNAALSSLDILTGRGVELYPSLAYEPTSSGFYKYYHLVTYSGYVWNHEPTNVTWTFGFTFDDEANVAINGVILPKWSVTGSNAWGTLRLASGELRPGANQFVLQLYNVTSSGGAIPYATGSINWRSDIYGLAYNPNGGSSTNGNDYVRMVDPGDGSLFTTAQDDGPVYHTLKMSPGTALDFGASTYSFTNELQVSSAVFAEPIQVVGTFAFGAGATVNVTDLATLDEDQAPYTILRTTGGVTGDFPSMGNRWFLKASSDGKDLLLDVIRGTVILFR